jgi:hypothetical protein
VTGYRCYATGTGDREGVIGENNFFFLLKSPAKEPQPSYVKLAMRNMVRKGGTSLKHFALTAVGLLSVLVGLAYLTR